MAGEALAATRFITPAVGDPRRSELHGACSQCQLARSGATIAHHQGVPVLVALAAMTLNVIVDFNSERFAQHPPCTLACDLVQQQELLTRFLSIPLLDYLQHRWRLPSNPVSHRAVALLTQKGTPPFSRAHQIHNFR